MTRRILYLIAFALFFIIASLLAFYAAGLRYNLDRGLIERVGVFYIKSYPEGASILINEVQTQKRTPQRLLNLAPGTYEVSVERPTYDRWTKSLEILPGETTFVRDIVLFKASPEFVSLSGGGSSFIRSPGGTSYTYAAADGSIHLTNVENEKDFIIKSGTGPVIIRAISPDGSRLIYSSLTGLHVLDINSETEMDLHIEPELVKKISWDTANDDLIWILRGSELVQFNLFANATTRSLLDIVDFLSTNGQLSTIEKDDDSYMATVYGTAAGQSTVSYALTGATDPRLASVSNQLIIYADATRVWALTRADSVFVEFNARLHLLHDQRLLLADSFEESLSYLEDKKTELIDRHSETTRSIEWHPSGSYFLRHVDDRAELVELDGRDVRNVHLVDRIQDDATFSFNNEGSRLFVLSSTTNGFYVIQ
ncbi:MAG: PEGA domain-containing protein [Patescibacteria group bacterium]